MLVCVDFYKDRIQSWLMHKILDTDDYTLESVDALELLYLLNDGVLKVQNLKRELNINGRYDYTIEFINIINWGYNDLTNDLSIFIYEDKVWFWYKGNVYIVSWDSIAKFYKDDMNWSYFYITANRNVRVKLGWGMGTVDVTFKDDNCNINMKSSWFGLKVNKVAQCSRADFKKRLLFSK